MATIATVQSLDRLEPLPLSPVEAAFWRVEKNFAGAYRAVVLFRLEGCIQAGPLAGALRHLQCRHPKLRATVVHTDNGPLRYQFEPEPPPIPFVITDYREPDLPWREETRSLLERGFPEAGPMAAVAVLRCPSRANSYLLLMVHHAIADGLSAIMLVDDLLTEYARAEGRVNLPPRPVLPPVTATRAKTSAKWWSRLWLLRRFMRLQRADSRSLQTPLPQAPGILPQSQWIHWVFSPEDTYRLVRRCRKERASLGGSLVAAVCCGLMDCLPIDAGCFKCQFPLNIRESLNGPAGPVAPDDLGCFVSIMNELCEVPQQAAFWSVARQAHKSLQVFMRHGGPPFAYNMAALASRDLFARAVPRLMASEQRVTLLANNYGVLNVKDAYGSLRPRECTLTFKNYAAGPSLVVQALVLGQRLNVGFVADGLDPAFWERLQVAVHQRFAAAPDND